MSNDTAFAGHEKVGRSILMSLEKKFVKTVVPYVPQGLETYHLTMMTLAWGALLIVFSFLARSNLVWLFGVSAMVALQYLTDLLDGAVGRHRETGLVKWGYYMDHFLDYVFTCCLVTGYYIIAPAGLAIYFLVLLSIAGAFMATSFLAFAATNKFEIYFCGVGPTEFRVLIIAVNTALIYTGVGHFIYTIPIVCVVSLAGLIALVYRTHKMLWAIDMEAKGVSTRMNAEKEVRPESAEAATA